MLLILPADHRASEAVSSADIPAHEPMAVAIYSQALVGSDRRAFGILYAFIITARRILTIARDFDHRLRVLAPKDD